jgi:CTP:molybdopterin cytidylyltransferase MocA
VLAALRAAGSVEEIIVVAGAYPLATDARVVHCPDWARGPGASLRCGFEAVSHKVQGAVVVLADGPDLDPRAVDRVVALAAGQAAAATYDGLTRSHPVFLPRSVWEDVPDEGARALALRLVPCHDLSAPGDIDTPEGTSSGDGES